MPELPEVQVVVNYLNKYILGKKIINIDVNLSKIIKNASVETFKSFFIDHYFTNIMRRGKYLIFELENKTCLVAHLRMEGKFFLVNNQYKISKHDHIVFHFNDQKALIYNDTRQFGTMEIHHSLQDAINSKSIKKLGYEPFENDFNDENLYKIAKNKQIKIKTFLLDQEYIAGIGNIYADEILFASKIHPESITKNVPKKLFIEIVKNTKEILNESIKHNGTTIHSFKFNNEATGSYQSFLKVHTKKNNLCFVCQTPIEKIEVGGRGTYFCHKCQKKY